MKHHPLAAIFPMMDEPQLEELADDIAANGLREDIDIIDDQIIDGRNREEACNRRGSKKRYRVHKLIPDLLGWIISKNLHRRHLTTSQRAAVAAEIARLRPGSNQKKDHQKQVAGIPATSNGVDSKGDTSSNTKIPTQTEAAEKMKVSRATVQEASKVLDASPELHEKVKAGEMTVNEAAKKVDEQKAEASGKPETNGEAKKPKSKRKKKYTVKTDELNDGLGLPVPKRLRDLFGDPWLRNLIEIVDTWLDTLDHHGWVSKLKNTSAAYSAYLRVPDAMTYLAEAVKHIEALQSTLAAGVPFTSCKACDATGKIDGKGCEKCRKTGFLPKWRYDELKAQEEVGAV